MSFVIPLVHSNFSFRLSLKPSVGRRPASQRLRLVSSNCTKKEGKREGGKKERERDEQTMRFVHTSGHLSSRSEKKKDGLAWRSSQHNAEFTHTYCENTRQTNTGQHRPGRYLERIRHVRFRTRGQKFQEVSGTYVGGKKLISPQFWKEMLRNNFIYFVDTTIEWYFNPSWRSDVCQRLKSARNMYRSW